MAVGGGEGHARSSSGSEHVGMVQNPLLVPDLFLECRRLSRLISWMGRVGDVEGAHDERIQGLAYHCTSKTQPHWCYITSVIIVFNNITCNLLNDEQL